MTGLTRLMLSTMCDDPWRMLPLSTCSQRPNRECGQPDSLIMPEMSKLWKFPRGIMEHNPRVGARVSLQWAIWRARAHLEIETGLEGRDLRASSISHGP